MEGFGPPPVLGLVQRQSCVIEPALIEKVGAAIWPCRPGEDWHRVGDQAELPLAGQQGFIRQLAVMDIRAGPVPTQNRAGFIAEV